MMDKVNMVYRSSGPNGNKDVELPFRVLVLSDLTLDERSEYFEEQQAISLTRETINNVLEKLNVVLLLSVPNKFTDNETENLAITLPITNLQGFHPSSIVNNVSVFKKWQSFRHFLSEFIDNIDEVKYIEMLKSYGEEKEIQPLLQTLGITFETKSLSESIDSHTLNFLIADIDDRLSRQMDEILHHKKFRQLESAWNSLVFLLDRADIKENIVIDVLNISQQALMDDFEDVPEVIQSQLYEHVYSKEFGQFGGRPYSVLIGNYTFSPNTKEVALLQKIASVASMSHAPFISAASPEFFDIEQYSDLTRVRNLDANFQQPKFIKWNSFRETTDAKYVALTLPSFLLRKPYDENNDPNIMFPYTESFSRTKQKGLWGNSAFAFVTRLLDSFSKTRWCLNINGKPDGQVKGLHIDGDSTHATRQGRIPTEILIPDRRDAELAKQGFISLSVHKGDDCAAFYTASSTQNTNQAGNIAEGSPEKLSAQLAAQVPYLFIVSRISHYIKMMQREHIGSWKTKQDIEKETNNWLKQYVSDMDNPAPGVRSRRPLRRAHLGVEEVPGKAGWFLINLIITPHIKYMGASFTLSDTGKLDKS